jgi:uncharacterized membrane protein YeaQ/YmgE (transglycosylase-associated protein family)
MVEKFVTFIIETFQHNKHTILVIVLGMVAGLVSQSILPGKGFGLVGTFIIGISGCFLGNHFINEYLTFIDNETLKTVVGGSIGAMGLSTVIGLFRTVKVKDKTAYRNNT